LWALDLIAGKDERFKVVFALAAGEFVKGHASFSLEDFQVRRRL
jgi:hypothetical protein